MNTPLRYFARYLAPFFLLFTLIAGGWHSHAPAHPAVPHAHDVAVPSDSDFPACFAATPDCALCGWASLSRTLPAAPKWPAPAFTAFVMPPLVPVVVASRATAAPRRPGRAPPVSASFPFVSSAS